MPDPSPAVLLTADGVRLAAEHWPGERDAGVVLAHGFTGHARNADVRRIAGGLHGAGFGVLVPDLRGHGRSGGVSTAGADERLDVAAAVEWLRGAGYRRIAVVGFSMGGSAVLRHAGLGGDADAVVAVSSPGTWFERGTRSMRLVHWMFEKKTGRLAVRLLRNTRVDARGWDAPPEAPADVVARIAPRPLLLVHGDADHYFPLHHLDALRTGAPTATVWIEAGMGHAELASGDELIARIAAWVRDALTGRAGDVGEVVSAPVCHDERRD